MKKTFKKILAATLSAAMIFGGSVMTFADTVSPDALNAGGTEEKIEDLVNKKVYSVKLPTTTFVTNHFSNMKLDPQGLISETSGDAYKNVSGISVYFQDIDSVTAGSILFRKEVAVSGSEVTAATYDTVSATLEAINCGTVPVTVHAVTTVSGLAAGVTSVALDTDGTFSGDIATKAAIWLSVTGASTYTSDSTAVNNASSAAVALANTYSTTANTGSATVVQAVSGAPATVYAVTTVAVASGASTVKAYKYEPVAEVLSPVAAASEDGVSVDSAVSGMAVNFRHPAFGKFEFNMTGIANPNADYEAWKDYKNISLSLDIVWKIEYDDTADNRSNGNVHTFTAGQPFTLTYEDPHVVLSKIEYNLNGSTYTIPSARYNFNGANGTVTIVFDATWTTNNAANFASAKPITVTYGNGDTVSINYVEKDAVKTDDLLEKY